MKRIRVEVPFILAEAERKCIPGEILSVGENTLSRILAINPNMVSVLGEVEEPAQAGDEKSEQPEQPEQAAQQPEQAPEQAAQEEKPAKKKQSKKK